MYCNTPDMPLAERLAMDMQQICHLAELQASNVLQYFRPPIGKKVSHREQIYHLADLQALNIYSNTPDIPLALK
jgi:hypothetical protein